MTNGNENDSENREKNYYYDAANNKRIPLVREPRVFAVRYRSGRSLRDSKFSPHALRLLRDDSKNIGFISNYGLQIYQTNPVDISLRTDPDEQLQDMIAHVKKLSKEDPIDYAAVAYRHNPDISSTRVGDLMFVTREFMVQFEPQITLEEIKAFNAKYGVHIVKELGYATNGYLLEAPEAEGEHGPVFLSNMYYESGIAKFAHPNFIRQRHLRLISERVMGEHAISVVVERTDQPIYLPQQWHLKTTKVVDAWNITRGSPDIKIAILDDGIDTGHQEFADKIVAQHDFASCTDNGSPNSIDDKHGTACAGVAVAKGIRASGAAPNCSLIAVRYPDFLGSEAEGEMFRWAKDQGSDVISCSWGPEDGTGSVDPLPDNVRAAIHYCVTEGRNGLGIPIFWAAGNGKELVSNDGYASNSEVMAVAASSNNELHSPYSDYGPEIFICAPSSGNGNLREFRIFTVDRRGSEGYNPDSDTEISHPMNDYDYTDDFGGTSSAAPLVAGIVGLMLSANPNLSVQDVRQILRDTADQIDLTHGNYDTKFYSNNNNKLHSNLYGYGRVNALHAVEKSRDFKQEETSIESGQPSISGPSSISRNSQPPIFQINTGGRPQYAVEVATKAELFNLQEHEKDRTSDNFFASWWNGKLESIIPYNLPTDVWDLLKKDADRLFYRLHVANDISWSNYDVTVEDKNANDAPSIHISDITATQQTVTFSSGAIFNVVETPLDSIDYSDSVSNGMVSLIEVRGRMQENLSRNFKVKELAATDGARYARISPKLVEGLQRIRDHVGSAVIVNSAYRHNALNKLVEGADKSQHITGLAADISSSTKKPLDLARIALEELGCDIGIGLGRNSIHVDLRGQLASWCYEGAELNENEFNQWIRDTCRQLGQQRLERVEYNERVAPSIMGPEIYVVSDEAPTFYIELGPYSYYSVELTTHIDLFNSQYEAERNSKNFYSSLDEEGLREAHGVTTYTLPKKIWERLRNENRLYYRIVTSATPTLEQSKMFYFTLDQQVTDAPWIELTGGRQKKEEYAFLPFDLHAIRVTEENLWRK